MADTGQWKRIGFATNAIDRVKRVHCARQTVYLFKVYRS